MNNTGAHDIVLWLTASGNTDFKALLASSFSQYTVIQLGLQKGGTFPVKFGNITEILEIFQGFWNLPIFFTGNFPPLCNPKYNNINFSHKIWQLIQTLCWLTDRLNTKAKFNHWNWTL